MKQIILIFCLICFMGCKNQNSNVPAPAAEVEPEQTQAAEPAPTNEAMYSPFSNDDQMAANIRNFLTQDYLKDDLAAMSENDRTFQFFKVDLNGDNKDEYFVNFMTPYFCGTGGCTVLLLDHESNVLVRFTSMETPIYIEKAQTEGWKDILVFSGGKLKQLKHGSGNKYAYPSNPSVVNDAPFDAPSGNAIIMFSDDFAKAKTYTF